MEPEKHMCNAHAQFRLLPAAAAKSRTQNKAVQAKSLQA